MPVEDEGRKHLDQYVKTWWDGAELMLNIYRKIAESGNDQLAQKAAQRGHDAARKWLFQFSMKNQPARRQEITTLEIILRRLAKR